MNQRIEKIRQLLNELEAEPSALASGGRDFSAVELCAIIQQLVDDLQPLLTPYDAATRIFASARATCARRL